MTTWLTASEAGEYVKTSERTIRDAVRAGDLPAYPIGKGREYRLNTDDVDAWMMSRSFEPRTA